MSVDHYDHTLRNVGFEDEKFLHEVVPEGETLDNFGFKWVSNRNAEAFAAATSPADEPAGLHPDELPTPAPATDASWNLKNIAGSYKTP